MKAWHNLLQAETSFAVPLELGGTARLEGERSSPRPGLRQRLACWRARRAAALELRSLPDRLLADIGLRREQIPAVVDTMCPIGAADQERLAA